MTTNDYIAAAVAGAFGTTAAVISHFPFSSDLNGTLVSRLNILPHQFIPNIKLSRVILVAYSPLL